MCVEGSEPFRAGSPVGLCEEVSEALVVELFKAVVIDEDGDVEDEDIAAFEEGEVEFDEAHPSSSVSESVSGSESLKRHE